MKKRILFSLQVSVFTLFILSFLGVILQLSGLRLFSNVGQSSAVYDNVEAFDPSLARLNSIKKLEQYCDSVYAEKVFAGGQVQFERTYTDIVSTTVRNKFYHGYSYYGIGDNYLGYLVSKVTIPGLSALVIPDEILKHPYAACSQQSIVMMEVLKEKGLSTRKISFLGKKYGGHFAFEVFYEGAWHFHDPNMEPDKTVLKNFATPGIEFLARNPDILVKAYSRQSADEILDIFPNYSYGPVNKFPAPKAAMFQRLTNFFSYTIWLVFLVAFIFIRRAYVRVSRKKFVKNNVIPLHHVQPGLASMYYSDYSA